MNIFINEEQRLRAGWRLLVQFIIMFLCVGLLSITLHSFWQSPSLLLQTFSSFAGITLSVWIAARLLDKRQFSDYGLTINYSWIRDFTAGTAIAALGVSVVFFIEWRLQWISITGYGWEMISAKAFGGSLLTYLLVMLMVGYYEELLSRGYQVLNLAEGLQFQKADVRGGVYLAVFLTSTVFALLHLNNPNASLTSTFTIIIAGIVLAIPFVVTGSLALSIGLHFGWNFAQGGIFGFPVSGINFDSPVIHIQQQGPPMWTGGSFGPEAGLLGLIGMAIMLGASCVYLYSTGYELTIAQLFKNEELTAMKSDEQAA